MIKYATDSVTLHMGARLPLYGAINQFKDMRTATLYQTYFFIDTNEEIRWMWFSVAKTDSVLTKKIYRQLERIRNTEARNPIGLYVPFALFPIAKRVIDKVIPPYGFNPHIRLDAEDLKERFKTKFENYDFMFRIPDNMDSRLTKFDTYLSSSFFHTMQKHFGLGWSFQPSWDSP